MNTLDLITLIDELRARLSGILPFGAARGGGLRFWHGRRFQLGFDFVVGDGFLADGGEEGFFVLQYSLPCGCQERKLNGDAESIRNAPGGKPIMTRNTAMEPLSQQESSMETARMR